MNKSILENNTIGKRFISWKKWGIILTIYIALKSIYTNESGSLQISDMFLIGGFICILFSTKGKLVYHNQTKSLIDTILTFVLYVCIVNGIWSVTGYNYSRFSLYYIFNFMAVIICCWIYVKVGFERFRQSILDGAFLSGLVTVLGMIRSLGSARNTAFFNNPNQLGYHGVVLISFAFLCKKNKNDLRHYLVFFIGCLAVILSLSKAAFISATIEIVLCTLFLERRKTLRVIAMRVTIIFIIAISAYLFFFSDTLSSVADLSALGKMRSRLFDMVHENDSGLGEGRGYDRILEMGSFFICGMGEGNFSRFSVMHGGEVHSTYASLIVSYGVIGIILYSIVLAKVIVKRNLTMRNIALLSGCFLYSISHNGVRNTLVWILLASIVIFNMPTNRMEGFNENSDVSN